MRVRRLNEFNLAFLHKWVWMVLEERDIEILAHLFLNVL